jgi:hypothetical protein
VALVLIQFHWLAQLTWTQFFAQCIADAHHDPFLSIDTAEDWVKESPLNLYQRLKDEGELAEGDKTQELLEDAHWDDLKEFKNFVCMSCFFLRSQLNCVLVHSTLPDGRHILLNG